MKKLVLGGCLMILAGAAQAQPAFLAKAAELLPSPGILRNGVSNLHAEGDSLWVGPFLNLTVNGGAAWQVADVDSLAGLRNRVYSLDVEGGVIWAGLGAQEPRDLNGQTEDIDLARGLVFSVDGGLTWQYRSILPPQDADPATTGILDLPEDTLLTYGISTLRALPVIVPEQSPPWDVDYDPVRDVVWSANWASGVRRSADGGRTWQRVILPPDDLDEIRPDTAYDFNVGPKTSLADPRGQFNHLGFSVLVDETGTIWAGTPSGINRSTDGGLSWRRFSNDGTPNALTGSWVISAEEQPLPGRNPVWMASWNAGEAGEEGLFGVTFTRDGGETFEQALLGERVFDFAFRDETVYVAGEGGLFISDDGGLTWRTVRDFRDPTQPDRTFRPGSRVLSVATTGDALWVGTDDGLLRSTDGARTWRFFRAEVPLNPDDLPAVVPPQRAPRVDAYAYPNPFSPSEDRFVRLRYKLDQPQRVEIRLFDFGMNLVRDLVDEHQNDGEREVSWDGTDNNGARVANGTYFYAVEAGGDTFWGKVLVLQ